jgi:hypothetical protein
MSLIGGHVEIIVRGKGAGRRGWGLTQSQESPQPEKVTSFSQTRITTSDS